jgi:hypothetical protein
MAKRWMEHGERVVGAATERWIERWMRFEMRFGR